MELDDLVDRRRLLPYVAAAWTVIVVLALNVFVARVTPEPTDPQTLLVFRLGGGLIALLAGFLAWFVVSEPMRLRERVDEATAALQKSRERFQQLYDEAPLVYITLDDEGTITRANRRTAEVLGYEANELVGERILDLFEDGPDGREKARDVLARFREGEDVRGKELAMRAASGERIWVNFAVRPVETPGEEHTRQTLSMVMDVTERRRAEEQLRYYARELERSNEDLQQFAYVISHDLQEPIRMIKSYLGLLDRRYADQLDQDAEDFIDYAVDGAERMGTLIQSLLEYSRVGTKGNPAETVDLDEVLEDVRADLAIAIEESGAEIEADQLPEVHADPEQLRQLIQNLVSNAIKYNDTGKPYIRIDSESTEEGHRVWVEDDGPGIPVDERQSVFDVFHRVGARPDEDGTGMGLAICKRIVERHGGSIEVVDSELGGVRFEFTLPEGPVQDHGPGQIESPSPHIRE